MKNQAKLSVGFLFDDTLDSSDGVAQYVKTLGAWLSAQGHCVTYIVGQSETSESSGGKTVSAARNLKISWGGNRLSIPVWPDKQTIKNLLAGQTFDVIHTQVPYSPLMAQYVINRLPETTALIGTFHVFPANNLVGMGSKLLKLAYGRSARRFDEMISVSPAAQTYANAGFGFASTVVPNVVDLRRFQRAKAAPNTRPRIVFLGRLVKRKGCLELLRAFELLSVRRPDVQLVIAGNGPLRGQLEKFTRRNGLSSKVRFLGYVDEKAKPDLLASADIACFPSLYGESFGIVLIEAMAAGSGVVLGGDNPGYRTVLGQQPQLLIDPRKTDLFAARLEALLSDQPLANKLHDWQIKAAKRYDVDSVGRRVLELYNRQIARRAKKSNNNAYE